jgi:hypothetical protein
MAQLIDTTINGILQVNGELFVDDTEIRALWETLFDEEL